MIQKSFFGFAKSIIIYLKKYKNCQDKKIEEICEIILQIGSADCFNDTPLWLLHSKETAKLAANCFTNMRAYCFCFSELKDSLGQWRGYANDGGGIAIGFNKKYLDSITGRGLLCPIFNFTLGDISYNTKRLDGTFDMLFNLRNKTNTTLFVAQNLFDIFHISTFFKNSSFKEEKEWL